MIDRQLIRLVDSAPFTRLIDYAVYTAARLQFALDYNSLTIAERTAYTNNIFETCKKSTIKDGNPTTIANLKKAFKTRHRKDVTSRNHLLKLYKMFGVSVFLDPSLEIRTKSGAPAFSETYVTTIDLLEQGLRPFSEYLDKVDQQNRVFLFNFLRAAGTLAVYNFIKNFVETFDRN
ncbi:uncharacterized protein EV420DRAFT_1121186 [Desarmillaria tabescens]|uniref:Uncharacterized protein n=1 Tax=Armillaria tabescens TaxID=1929756 RepID=A0AA39JG88_ARMTA|nr:uncharacterized protein EV420DRAFT_1121186 [Desarmillaria tabescens]KAK0441221.1 hypothetical protein EV420DRAFT_1121186 [Desarmillaria tabescens]